jgi:hypothetical protein
VVKTSPQIAPRAEARPHRPANVALGRMEGLGIALPPFVASKAIGVLVPLLTVWARSGGLGTPPASTFLHAFAQWDGSAYARIAALGYPSGPLSTAIGNPDYVWARFPGYPLLVHVVGYVVPQTVAAGMLVSTIGELVALVFLAKLVLGEGRSPADARFACWTLAVFPYAFYMTAVYTEGAFLAFTLACLYWMRRGHDGRASLAAAGAIFIHVTGVALVPALVVDHLLRRRGRPGWGLVAIAASLLALGAFALWAWLLTGDPLAYVRIVQSASFNRLFAWPWAGARTTWDNAVHGQGGNSFIFGMEVIFGVFWLGVVAWMAWWWRRIAPSLTVFAAGAWLLSACVVYWLGMPRLMMTAAPVYLAFVEVTRRRPGVRPLWVGVSAGWMGFLCALAATGHFVA